MTNHIHLQIETIEHQPGRIMQYLTSNYAKYYNHKYAYKGHLFQGRYIGELIDSDIYMLQTSRYIHLNPVKAKLVEKPAEYKWSSYSVYIGGSAQEKVSENKILDYFIGDADGKIECYTNYVTDGLFRLSLGDNEEDMSEEVIKFEEKVEF